MRIPFAGLAVLLIATLALPACGALLAEGTSDAAGIAGAGIAAGITKNATIGAAIGLGVKSLADTGLKYAQRRVHRYEQDGIAAVAGATAIGATAPWSVEHDLPIEDDEHGQLAVIRDIGGSGLACREIVFSVERGKPEAIRRGFYTATVCQDGAQWKWATAEPATERWGSLQ